MSSDQEGGRPAPVALASTQTSAGFGSGPEDSPPKAMRRSAAYAFVLEAVTLRLAELGFAGVGLRSRWVIAACFFPSFFRARYVRSYLRGAASRVRCAWRYARQLIRVGAPHRAAEARRLSFDRDLLARARRVVSAYG